MLNLFRRPGHASPLLADPNLLGAHARAAANIARLDQALEHHPLLPAFLHRARLDAVRRQAAVDGRQIDPWHLAAVLEGLRLRMESELRIVDRGQIFEAARTALQLHQWLTAPDFDQEGEVQQAEQHLTAILPGGLLAAAQGTWSWLERGGTRPPLRAALIRYWQRAGLLRAPAPLTGAFALRADAPETYADWVGDFFDALADEAADQLEMLRALQRGWSEARRKTSARRRNSRAAQAVDLLAATPLLSATTLGKALGMSVKCAGEMLDRFVAEGIVIEVTHRSARRLFGLTALAPLRDIVQPPRRSDPNQRRGRPYLEVVEEPPVAEISLMPSQALLERPVFDYTDLDAAMAQLDVTIKETRRKLQAVLP
jgi:hypothetical protein